MFIYDFVRKKKINTLFPSYNTFKMTIFKGMSQGRKEGKKEGRKETGERREEKSLGVKATA